MGRGVSGFFSESESEKPHEELKKNVDEDVKGSEPGSDSSNDANDSSESSSVFSDEADDSSETGPDPSDEADDSSESGSVFSGAAKDSSEPGSDSSNEAYDSSGPGSDESGSVFSGAADPRCITTTTTQVNDGGKNGKSGGSKASSDSASQKSKQWDIYSDPDIKVSKQRNQMYRNRFVLWQILVEPYLKKHKPPKPTALVYDVGSLLGDEIIDNFSNATAITAAALNIDNAKHAEGDADHPKITSGENADDHIKTNNLLANGLLFTSGLFNTASGIKNVLMSGESIYNAKKERNCYKRKQGRYGLAAGFSGIASGVLQSAGAGANIAGSSAGAGLSLAAYIADFTANAINAFGAASNARHHSKTGDLAERYHSNDKIKNLSLDNEKDKDQRRLIKAQTYAMQQASRFNREKGEQEKTRAIREAIFGAGSSLVGVVAGAIPMLTDYGKGMMGSGIAGLVQMGMKYVGKGVRVKNHVSKERQNKQRKTEEVEKYLDTKINKVKTDAQVANLQQLSDNLAKRVALARLGLDVELDENAGIADDVYDKAFDIITIKRAGHIKAAQERTIFNILGLPMDASVLEIAEALGYGD